MLLLPKRWSELGFRTDNVQRSLIPYLVLSAVLILGFFLILKTFYAFSISTVVLWHTLYPSFAIVVVLSAIQELFFRGYLIFVLKNLSKSIFIVVLIDAVLFAALHAFFSFPEILVPAAFLEGVLFATTYYYYPNLFLASATHIALVMSSPMFCYFKLVGC